MTHQTSIDYIAQEAPARMPLRPLGIIQHLIESLGLDITYTYDDLVFIEYNAFLLEMSAEHGEEISIWFNEESTPANRQEILSRIKEAARSYGLLIERRGTYSLTARDESETVDIHFHDPA